MDVGLYKCGVQTEVERYRKSRNTYDIGDENLKDDRLRKNSDRVE